MDRGFPPSRARHGAAAIAHRRLDPHLKPQSQLEIALREAEKVHASYVDRLEEWLSRVDKRKKDDDEARSRLLEEFLDLESQFEKDSAEAGGSTDRIRRATERRMKRPLSLEQAARECGAEDAFRDAGVLLRRAATLRGKAMKRLEELSREISEEREKIEAVRKLRAGYNLRGAKGRRVDGTI